MAKYRVIGFNSDGKQIMADVEATCELDITEHPEECGFSLITFIMTEEQAFYYDETSKSLNQFEVMRVAGLSYKAGSIIQNKAGTKGVIKLVPEET